MSNIREELRSHLDAMRTAGVTLTMDVSMPALDAVEGRIKALNAEQKVIFDEAGPSVDFKAVKSLGDVDTVQVVEHVQRLNAELNELAVKRAGLLNLKARAADAADENVEHGAERRDVKSVGDLFAKSAVRTQFGAKATLDVSVKTLMTRASGWDPESFREPGYVAKASAPIMVTDVFPSLPTGRDTIKYMEQITRTSNAAERAEGGTYGEAAFVLTEQNVVIETLGVWIPVTDEQLEDEAEAATMINDELPFMLRQRLDLQLLVGDGNTPNILGINNKASISTQAKGSDPVFDAVHKAMTKVQVTGRAMPSHVIMHPNDWEGVRLTRTADGLYVLGSPTDVGPRQVWGVPVVVSDNQTENTAVVADLTNWARLYIRRGIVVERTNAHDTFFINGKQAIRASFRCATVFKRAAAICTVTGI